MIKEEYRNIPDTEFIPLKDGVDSAFWGKYEINKLGEIKCLQSGIITRSVKSKNGHYPRKSFRVGEFKKGYSIHRLVALTFLTSEEGKPEVDHIDRDINNYQLSNLRWSSREDNLKNRKFPTREGKIRYLKLNNNGEVIEEIDSCNIPKKRRNYINKCIRDKKQAFGFYWGKHITQLEKFLEEGGISLDEELFVPMLRFPEFKISESGIVKRRNEFVIGWEDSKEYRKISIDGHPYYIHRLVYETFSNSLLEPDIIIDHIDTNKLNNSFSNLRKCTQKENMNNEKTKEKLSKKVQKFSLDDEFIEEFKSMTAACNSIGIARDNNCIRLCCEGKLKASHGFKWKYAK